MDRQWTHLLSLRGNLDFGGILACLKSTYKQSVRGDSWARGREPGGPAVCLQFPSASPNLVTAVLEYS